MSISTDVIMELDSVKLATFVSLLKLHHRFNPFSN